MFISLFCLNNIYMITIVTYDITSPRRLSRLHRFLRELGINTQKSVFECELDNRELRLIRHYCRDNLDLNSDSVRIYRVCSRCMKKVRIQGQGIKIAQLEYQII